MALPNDTFSAAVVGGRRCEPWAESRHFLLQAAQLCFAAAFAAPAARSPALHGASRALLCAGFGCGAAWAALRSCTGPDVVAWGVALMAANGAQTAYAAFRAMPPRLAPQLHELYAKVFAPLRVPKEQFRQLVRHAHLEPLDPGEHYAVEGVTGNDQRLAVLLAGKMKVTCEDILLHYLLPTEFVDSPEWESCATNIDKRFQVTLTATEPCQLLCWGRKELLTILESNQFLNVVMYNLIGKDITHKLYSLNEQRRRDAQDKVSIAGSLEFWRNPLPRSHSVDMVHTGNEGHVRSLFWKKPERRRTDKPENLGDSRTSNFSDPGPRQKQSKTITKKPSEESQYETPV